jgi:geranylgeranyl diphosphate synthase type 3
LYCKIDDIRDNSILCRGIPVAHSVYGVPSTTNASIYLILKRIKRAQSLKHPDAITVGTEVLLDMYYGQGLEICCRENYTCPSLEEYKKLIQKSKKRTEP